jgi:hypothetical protein
VEYDYSICLSEVNTPTNDLCNNPITVPVSPTLTALPATSGSTYSSTSPNIPNWSGDVWYKFTATSTTHILQYESEQGCGYWLATRVWKGDDCDNLTLIYDRYNSYGLNANYLYNLTIGETYYISIYDNDKIPRCNFHFYIVTPPAPPSNDLCANAIAAPVNPSIECTQTVKGTMNWAQPNFGSYSCSDKLGEVWYKFTATSKLHHINIKNAANYSLLYPNITPILYADCDTIFDTGSGNNCYNSVIDTTQGFSHFEYRNLTIGKEYFIQLYHSTGNGEAFDVCVTTPPYTPNISCDEALALPVSDTSFCSNYLNQDFKFVKTAYSSSFGDYVKVGWFKFEAKTTRHRVEIKNLSQALNNQTKLYYTVLEDCDLSSAAVYFQNEWYTPTPDSIMRNLKIGQTYYVAVAINREDEWRYSTELGDFKFDIAVSTFPSNTFNDDPEYAQTIPVNGLWSCQNSTQGTTLDATPTLGISSGQCMTGTDDDVWYKFVAKKSQHFISIKNIKPEVGDVIDMNYELFTAATDGSFENNSLGCQESRQYTLGAWDLEEGRTYYLRIFTQYINGYSRCSFDVCITTPIVQDAPKGAVQTTLLAAKGAGGCEHTATASSIGATYSYEAGVLTGACEQISLPKDIWFKTEITSKKPKIAFKFNQFPTGAVPQVAAYRLKNGVLQAFSSNTCPFDTLNGMKQNDVILFRVWDALDKNFGTYEICVTETGIITSIDDDEATAENTNPIPAEIQLYPNPATDEITLQLQHLHHDHITTTISNLAGQTLYQQQYVNNENGALTLQIPITDLPASTYILVITDGAQRYYKKFVKM